MQKTESLKLSKTVMAVIRKSAKENGRTIKGEIERILWAAIKEARS